MSYERCPITNHGAEKMRQELEHLEKVERPNVVTAIAEARAHGDLSENAEYDAAKNKQAFIEGKINELRHQLSIADIIDVSLLSHQTKITFGATVELYDIINDEYVSYQIVGDYESDIENGKISFKSLVARNLIGKTVDEQVDINTPSGLRQYKVIKFAYV